MKHPDTIVPLSVDDSLEMAVLLGHISSGTMSRLEGLGFSGIREVLDYENEKGMSLRFVQRGIGQKTQTELHRLRLFLHYPFGTWKEPRGF